MPFWKKNSPRWLMALSVFALSALGSILLGRTGIGKESIIMVYLMGVLFTTVLTGRYSYGMICAVASVMLFNFLFTEPRYTLVIDSTGDFVLILFFLATAVVCGTVTTKLQKQMELAGQNARSARLLYKTAEGFLHVTGENNVNIRAMEYIKANTGCESMIDLRGRSFPEGAKIADYTPCARYPIQSSSEQLGFLVVKRDDLDEQKDLLIRAIAAQVGMALERESMYQERENIRIAMEREKLRGDLLRAVAHDLRSPLTALSGSSRLLADSFEKLSVEEQKKLVSNISEEIVWLSNLVENILNMTRITESQLLLHREEEVIDDVVSEALEHMQTLLVGRRISVALPKEVVTVPMDGKLIVQVLVNLLENALRHGGQEAEISLKALVEGGDMLIVMSDTGKGIDPAVRDRLFERFVTLDRGATDSVRGMGLGLCICKAIVEAHGGRIWAEENVPRGAKFSFTLPLRAEE